MRKKIKLLSIILCIFTLTGCDKSSQKELTISVATSLSDPINKIIEEYEKENNVTVNVNYGGSGTLKNQIANGADAYVFFSANEKFMNELVDENMVKEEDVTVPISNSLVLIKSEKCEYDIKSLEDILKYDVTMAIGQIDTVPAGQYAKESLEKLGIFNKIEKDLVYGKDVSAVKNYVETSEVDLGIVYKSDTLDLKKSEVVLEIPEDTHEKINYTLAPINGNEDGKKIIEFINSKSSKEILKEYGFLINE
ncbi:molybdate ABC transporter substrate-binding protein [Terrisporobacter sp.]|uniref:molybdate ABC transporter substrate-binding protein n=1 Tax=Terrisporobacter sp. TaxID=1965305 RepID=UPI002633F054|nr:molybdate ABC transporter substrate-binding protein [Terrisporobacter sp.]